MNFVKSLINSVFIVLLWYFEPIKANTKKVKLNHYSSLNKGKNNDNKN